jgi:hypothetical protein
LLGTCAIPTSYRTSTILMAVKGEFHWVMLSSVCDHAIALPLFESLSVHQCTLRLFGTNNDGSLLLRDPSGAIGVDDDDDDAAPAECVLTDDRRITDSERFDIVIRDDDDSCRDVGSSQKSSAGALILGDDPTDGFRPLLREVTADTLGTLKKSISTGRLRFRWSGIGDGFDVAEGGVGGTSRGLLFDDDAPTNVTSSESESSSSLRSRRRGRSATVPFVWVAGPPAIEMAASRI